MTPDEPQVSSFDEAKFRQVLGHFATGVVVVAAIDEHQPFGLAVGSFASVSLDPPLVAFFPSKSSSSWPHIERAGVFSVNVLGSDQEDICRIFASSGADKFSTIGWRPGRSGAPVINDVIASIECSVERVDDAGDHWMVFGRVQDLEVNHEGGPLIFFRGGYGSFTV